MSLILPESVARELEAAGRENPEVIRKVIEGAVMRNLGISEEAWDGREGKDRGLLIKPPYEGCASRWWPQQNVFQRPEHQTIRP